MNSDKFTLSFTIQNLCLISVQNVKVKNFPNICRKIAGSREKGWVSSSRQIHGRLVAFGDVCRFCKGDLL